MIINNGGIAPSQYLNIDGAPYAMKVARPVWSRGKNRDNIKFYLLLYQLEKIDSMNFELGYLALMKIFRKIINFYEFKAIIYFINIFCIYKVLKKCFKDYESKILILLYFYGPFFLIWLTAIRQSIAISIYLYSIIYIYEKKMLKFILSIVIASLFHKSALILLPTFLLINYMKLSNKNLVKIYIFSLFLMTNFSYELFINLFLPIANYIPKFKIYLENNMVVSSLSPYILFYNLVFLYYIINLLLNRLKIDNRIINGFIIFYFCAILERKFRFFYRIIPYFSIFLLLMIILLIDQIKSRGLKKVLWQIISIFFFIVFNIRLIHEGYKSDKRYIPYNSYLKSLVIEIPYDQTAEYYHVISRDK